MSNKKKRRHDEYLKRQEKREAAIRKQTRVQEAIESGNVEKLMQALESDRVKKLNQETTNEFMNFLDEIAR
jgi:galactose-1-phosphate uridylyltransferase